MQCDNCEGYLHHSCADIPLDELQRFTRSRAKGFRFICKSCVNIKSDERCNLKNIHDLLKSLRESIDNINYRLSNLESQIAGPVTLPLRTFEDVVGEAVERISRARNIIVSGVPESVDAAEASRSIIVTTCGSDNNIFATKAHRIGKIGSKPRLIKIEFDRRGDVLHVLKNKDKLKTSIISKYRVFSDQTLRQRNYLKDLRQELSQRTQQGESNLTIKYFRGTPKIVQDNVANQSIDHSDDTSSIGNVR